MKKELILRRLIAGIALILVAAYTIYLGITYSSMGVQSGYGELTSLGGDLAILGSGNLIAGIILVSTSYMFPKKWIDYIVIALSCFSGTLCLVEFPQSEFTNGFHWALLIICIVSLLVAIPWSKNGYPNMPYQSTSSNSPQMKTKNNTNNSYDYTEEIAKLKNLLDDNAITQEEYDAKKKQLLDL